jgi:hypothetical protein
MTGENESTTDLAAEIGEEGTLASIQARVPKLRFDAETDTLKEEAPAQEEKEEKTGEETAEEQAAREAAEKKAQEEKPPQKYKNKAEAEKAALEATRKMTEATTETAKERAAREAAEKEAADLKAETADLRKKLEEANAAKPETEAEKKAKADAEALSTAERRTALKTATSSALDKISALQRPAAGDQEAEKAYRDKVSDAWAEAFEAAGIGGMTLSKAEMEKMVKETMKAEKEAQDAADKEKNKAATQADINVKATELATAGGLDMTEGSSDFNNFWFIAQGALQKQDFMKAEKAPALKEQVDWVVAKVKEIKAEEVAKLEANRDKTRRTQAKNTPMVKGTTAKTETTETETSDRPSYSMAELQANIREKAREKHRGA